MVSNWYSSSQSTRRVSSHPFYKRIITANTLQRLFPYLRFLKADYSMDWPTFSKYFCDPNNPECYSRITTLLSYTMMRRTMKTTILNRPIITLPEPHPLIEYIHFSPEEQIIYRIVCLGSKRVVHKDTWLISLLD